MTRWVLKQLFALRYAIFHYIFFMNILIITYQYTQSTHEHNIYQMRFAYFITCLTARILISSIP